MATTRRPRTTKKATESKETPVAKKAPAATPVATVTTRAVDMQEAIRSRAYEFFAQRGYQHGADLDDWLRAEQEIRQRFNYSAA